MCLSLPSVYRASDGPGHLSSFRLRRWHPGMDLDDLLVRYFGTFNLSEASPAMQTAGLDRLSVDFGLEQDRRKRFAL